MTTRRNFKRQTRSIKMSKQRSLLLSGFSVSIKEPVNLLGSTVHPSFSARSISKPRYWNETNVKTWSPQPGSHANNTVDQGEHTIFSFHSLILVHRRYSALCQAPLPSAISPDHTRGGTTVYSAGQTCEGLILSLVSGLTRLRTPAISVSLRATLFSCCSIS